MRNLSGNRRFGPAALLLLVGGLAWFFTSWLGRNRLLSAPIDFVAFYCGGRTAALGLDPYLAGPMRVCENAAAASVGVHVARYLVVPAPLPPYALALVAPLGLLPFVAANAVWLVSLLLAAVVTVVLLRSLTRLSLPLIVACVFLADVFPSIFIGQIVPLIVALLAGAAVALQAGRPRLAALLAACTLIETHVGLPACLALFVWERRARIPLLAALGVLGLLSLCDGGVARNLEYGLAVLPAHARAEGLEFSAQYSLSALLGQFGLSERLALELGSLSYLAMTVLGVWTAGRLVRPLQNAGVLVLAAPAFALFGGVYVHVHQMAVALPLGLLLLSRWRSQRLAAALTLAIVVLAVPWQTLVEYGLIAAPPPAASRANAEAEMSRVGADDRLAEDVWAVWVRSGVHDGRTRLEQAAVKLPTWLSLGSILAFAVSLAARRQRKVTAPEPRPLVVAG